MPHVVNHMLYQGKHAETMQKPGTLPVENKGVCCVSSPQASLKITEPCAPPALTPAGCLSVGHLFFFLFVCASSLWLYAEGVGAVQYLSPFATRLALVSDHISPPPHSSNFCGWCSSRVITCYAMITRRRMVHKRHMRRRSRTRRERDLAMGKSGKPPHPGPSRRSGRGLWRADDPRNLIAVERPVEPPPTGPFSLPDRDHWPFLVDLARAIELGEAHGPLPQPARPADPAEGVWSYFRHPDGSSNCAAYPFYDLLWALFFAQIYYLILFAITLVVHWGFNSWCVSFGTRHLLYVVTGVRLTLLDGPVGMLLGLAIAVWRRDARFFTVRVMLARSLRVAGVRLSSTHPLLAAILLLRSGDIHPNPGPSRWSNWGSYLVRAMHHVAVDTIAVHSDEHYVPSLGDVFRRHTFMVARRIVQVQRVRHDVAEEIASYLPMPDAITWLCTFHIAHDDDQDCDLPFHDNGEWYDVYEWDDLVRSMPIGFYQRPYYLLGFSFASQFAHFMYHVRSRYPFLLDVTVARRTIHSAFGDVLINNLPMSDNGLIFTYDDLYVCNLAMTHQTEDDDDCTRYLQPRPDDTLVSVRRPTHQPAQLTNRSLIQPGPKPKMVNIHHSGVITRHRGAHVVTPNAEQCVLVKDFLGEPLYRDVLLVPELCSIALQGLVDNLRAQVDACNDQRLRFFSMLSHKASTSTKTVTFQDSSAISRRLTDKLREVSERHNALVLWIRYVNTIPSDDEQLTAVVRMLLILAGIEPNPGPFDATTITALLRVKQKLVSIVSRDFGERGRFAPTRANGPIVQDMTDTDAPVIRVFLPVVHTPNYTGALTAPRHMTLFRNLAMAVDDVRSFLRRCNHCHVPCMWADPVRVMTIDDLEDLLQRQPASDAPSPAHFEVPVGDRHDGAARVNLTLHETRLPDCGAFEFFSRLSWQTMHRIYVQGQRPYPWLWSGNGPAVRINIDHFPTGPFEVYFARDAGDDEQVAAPTIFSVHNVQTFVTLPPVAPIAMPDVAPPVPPTAPVTFQDGVASLPFHWETPEASAPLLEVSHPIHVLAKPPDPPCDPPGGCDPPTPGTNAGPSGPQWWRVDAASDCLYVACLAHYQLRKIRCDFGGGLGLSWFYLPHRGTTRVANAAHFFDAIVDDDRGYVRTLSMPTTISNVPSMYLEASHDAGHASFVFYGHEREVDLLRHALQAEDTVVIRPTPRTTKRFSTMLSPYISFVYVALFIGWLFCLAWLWQWFKPYEPDCFGTIYRQGKFVQSRVPEYEYAAQLLGGHDYQATFFRIRDELIGYQSSTTSTTMPHALTDGYLTGNSVSDFLVRALTRQLYEVERGLGADTTTVWSRLWSPITTPALNLAAIAQSLAYDWATLVFTPIRAIDEIDYTVKRLMEAQEYAFACAADVNCRRFTEFTSQSPFSHSMCNNATFADRAAYQLLPWLFRVVGMGAFFGQFAAIVCPWVPLAPTYTIVHHQPACPALDTSDASLQFGTFLTRAVLTAPPCLCKVHHHDLTDHHQLREVNHSQLPFIAEKAVSDPNVVPIDAWTSRALAALNKWKEAAPRGEKREINPGDIRDAILLLVRISRENYATAFCAGSYVRSAQCSQWQVAPFDFAVRGRCGVCAVTFRGIRHVCDVIRHKCGYPTLQQVVAGKREQFCTFCDNTPFAQRLYRYVVSTQETSAVYRTETWHHVRSFFMPSRIAMKTSRPALDALIKECGTAPDMPEKFCPQLCGIGFTARLPFVTKICRETAMSCLRGRAMVPQRFQSLWVAVEHTIKTIMTPALLSHGPLEPTPFPEWNARFPRGRRNENARAYERLKHTPLDRRDTMRKVFIKREKLIKDLSQSAYAGRAISSTSAASQVSWGPYAHAVGQRLKKVYNGRGTHFYATGMDVVEIGAVLQSWLDEGYLFGSDSDFSKYDATIHGSALESEHWVYQKLFPQMSGDARKVLEAQRHSHGIFSLHGSLIARFSFLARRNSGDANTSCGNTILNLAMAMTCMAMLGIDARIAVVGDDAFFATRVHLGPYASRIRDIYSAFGFDLDFHARDNICQVSFLGSKLMFANVDGKRQLILAPDLSRFVAKSGWALDKQNRPLGWARGVMTGFLPVSPAIPVMHQIVSTTLRLTSRETRVRFEASDTAARCHQVKRLVTMAPDAYDQVCLAYGLEKQELVELCDMISSCEALPALIDTSLCMPLFEAE